MSLYDDIDTSSEETQVPEQAEATPIEQSSGAETEQNSVWYYDENVAGTNEKPEWLQEKYKSVSEQAKAYGEIQKKLGAFKGAPDEYAINIKEEGVKLSDNDPILKEFLTDAKENNVSQEYVDKLLNTYAKGLRYGKPDPKKELEALGPNAAQDLTSLSNWAGNTLSKDELSTFQKMMTTAESVRVFQKIKSLTNKAPTQPGATMANQPTKESILKKVRDPRYKDDPAFRKQVRDELTQVV